MSGMTREEAIVVIWNRCQHCKETEEAIKALKEQMICPIFSDDEVKQPCIKSPCGFERPHGECKTCKHFVKGGIDGKTYVCEHPHIEQDDYYNYACLAMNETDFCSCYERKEGEAD